LEGGLTVSNISASITDKDKLEIIRQWNNDPCEAVAAKGLEIGTKAFYERIDRYRYQEYAPWMKSVMDYDKFAGKRLLEVGFGMGTDLFQFASHGAIVSGLDLTPKHLEIASQRFELYGIPADLRLGDAEQMPYEDETFDAVYTFGVIHHSPNTDKIVDEIYRILKPGGRAIISVYHKHSLAFLWLLSKSVLKLRFLREPWRRTMSRVEYRENSDACPLVKVYSRRDMRRLLKAFRAVEFDANLLSSRKLTTLRGVLPSSLISKLEHSMGWFLIAKCVK
jgi:ubiquinone/menaquinone biosynthesis C-methylase UbiE